MNDFIININPGYLGFIWLIVAIFFLILEIGTPGLFFFVAFAVGSGVASIFAFLEYGFMSQCIAAITVTIVSFFIFRHYLVKGSKKIVNTNVDALIGQKAVVLTKIEPYKFGQVKINGEIWAAESEKKLALEVNEIVSVVKIIGNRVIVKQ